MGNCLTTIEAKVAKMKVNAGLDKSQPALRVTPDADFSGPSRFDHSLWDSIMRRHVSPGQIQGVNANLVDYPALGSDPDFNKYVKALETVDVDALSPNEKLALYINAYNALCIGHVVRYAKDHDGTLPESVTKVAPAGSKGKEVWDVPAGVVGGTEVSLNDIEHTILRSKWDEPRVHASIVCASASCPNLRREAFVPDKINAQMDDQARSWMSDPTKGIKVEGNAVTMSRIFLWFQGDFDKSGGPVTWANRYLDGGNGKLTPNMRKEYFTYNWSLNKK